MITRIFVSALAALTLLAPPAMAQSARLEQPSVREINVVGGANAAWRLRYGMRVAPKPTTLLVDAAPGRAYFVHGSWLRLIDTERGLVIGRWRFPYTIEALTPAGSAVDVRIQMPPWAASPNVTVRFDPAAGNVPDFDVGALISYRTAEFEALELLLTLAPGPDPWAVAIPTAAQHIAVFDDMVARDPSAPMLHLARAKLLLDAGDPRAAGAFADLLRVASTDFTEWFRIASILEYLPVPQPEASRAAFDRAMGDFIKRDRDPRLVDTLIARLILYPVARNLTTLDEPRRQVFLDRIYQLAPTGEATERAWAIHADALAAKGEREAGVLWRERAAASARESLFLSTIDLQLRHDRYKLLALGSLLAAILYIIMRHAKYAAQRRMHAAAALRNQEPLFASWLGWRYWNRRERWSLLAIAVVGWLAMGHSWTFARVMFRSASLPVHVGTIDGHQDFIAAYPPSPERDLLYALALQYSGRLDESERLYRSLPQFAESWNNLGVMLTRSGRLDEGRQAFDRALTVDPTLPEAVLNRTGEARTLATQTFQKYAPGMKMIAIPPRDRWLRGYLGPVWTSRYWRAVMGSLDAIRFGSGGRTDDFLSPVLFGPTIIGGALLGVLIILSLTGLTFLRYQDATVPPGRVAEWLTWLIPGTAPAWRWAGIPIVIAWSTVMLALVLQLTISTPYLLIRVGQSGIMRAFGYPTGSGDLNPPLALLIGVVVVLWMVNGALIRSSSRPLEATS